MRRATIFSSPTNAPPQIKRMLVVSTGRKFLVRMLASALRRNVGDGAFKDLEQRLLHAFTAHVARDGRVLILAADLVDFVDIDDAGLRAAYVAISSLQQFENDIFNVLTHIAGFSERGGVHNGKRHIEHAGQSLRQQRFARAGGADQHDVGFRQLHFAGLGAVHVDPLVVVVNGDGKLFLGLVLPDDVFIEERFDLLRLGQMVGSGGGMRFRAVVFQNGVADGNALVADVSPGIVAG